MNASRPVLLGLLLCFGLAGAESYRVQLNNLPPAYVPDAWSYAAQIEIDPAPAKSRAVILPPKDRGKLVSPPLPAGRDLGAVRLVGRAPPQAPRSQVVPEVFLEPVKTKPDREFLGRLEKYYRVTKPDQQQAIWKWYQSEPDTLKSDERLDNAFIRHTMASGQKTALEPGATEGTIQASFPVTMRTSPFGSTDRQLSGGTKVKLLPPPDGAWYRVETDAGIGWVCGLWLDAK